MFLIGIGYQDKITVTHDFVTSITMRVVLSQMCAHAFHRRVGGTGQTCCMLL
jgi:hypothetical protein